MSDLKKSDIVLCVISNDLGKVRPAIIVQKTDFIGSRDALVVCSLTSDIINQSVVRPTISRQRNWY